MLKIAKKSFFVYFTLICAKSWFAVRILLNDIEFRARKSSEYVPWYFEENFGVVLGRLNMRIIMCSLKFPMILRNRIIAYINIY